MKFRNASIKQKLTMLMVLVSSVVLFLVAGAMMVVEIISFRQSLVNQVAGMVEVVAEQSVAGLVMNKKIRVEKVLESLANDQYIRAAFVFRENRPFAYYLNSKSKFRDSETSLPYSPSPLLDQATSFDTVKVQFTRNHLSYLSPIVSEGRILGHLYVQTGLDELNARLAQFAAVLVTLLLFSVLLSLLLASRLQKVVSDPMLKLFGAMSRVSARGDFSVRVVPENRDEVGVLMEGFNNMLEQLELRDSQLQDYRENLESQVVQRTEELQLANTDLQSTISALAESRDRAEAANRAKSQFLANMSHEIRTPMIGVLGMTELLFNTGLTDKQRQLAQTVFNSGEALLEILNDLLDFSKIEAGKLTLVDADFDLREIIEEVLGLLGENASSKGLELICSIPSGIPLGLHGDGGRLRQILLNLVGNAIKFTEKGEVVLRVQQLWGDDLRARYAIEIQDTGIGIHHREQDHVFDSFSQADEAMGRQFGGTGLGLAIVRQLVNLMEGEIRLKSAPGEGSCFTLELEFARQQEVSSLVNPMPVHLQGKRVLIVEDHQPTATSLMEKLLGLGLEVDIAASGRQALSQLRQQARSEPYALAILDADMAGLGGRRLVAAIASEKCISGLHIVMLCNPLDVELTSPDDLSLPVDWLHKPIRPSELVTVLIKALSQHGLPAGEEQKADSELINLPKGWRILLVEDNPTTRNFVQSALAPGDGSLAMAHNGQEALDLLEEETVDLVLMDCQMPVMDGFEATEKLRQRGFSAPIIALTARAFHEDVDACLAVGMNDHLCKPFRQKDLFRLLGSWLQESPAGNRVEGS